MTDKANTPSTDKEKKNIVHELIQLIDEFLEASDKTSKQEDIANSVFFFLGNDVKMGLNTYSNAAASALLMFATDNKIVDSMESIIGDDYHFLCEMLQRVVEFCNNLRFSEANLAQLDKSKWEIGPTSHLSKEDVINEKKMYEYKLKHLRESIQNNK